MKPTGNDIRRRLGLREVPKPPADLASRLKADIPASFRYTTGNRPRPKGELASGAFRGMSWQVAASFLALTIVGVGIYMVTFDTASYETATIAEADRAPEMEFAPPVAPPASAAPSEPAAALEKLQVADSKLKQSADGAGVTYDIPASPPPPPPPPRMARADAPVDGGVEGGVSGGVVGGVLAGVIPSAQSTEIAEARPAEAEPAKGKDARFAEDSTVASAAAPAPARSTPKAEPTESGRAATTAQAQLANEVVTMESLRVKAAAGEPLRIGGAVKAPVVLKRVEPQFSGDDAARSKGIVIVEAIIDRNGDVKSVRVVKSSWSDDEAVIRAVKQWKFRPATLEGKPVDAVFNLTMNF